MSELVEFIRGCLDADEQTARAAGVGEWEAGERCVWRPSPIQSLEVVTDGQDGEGGAESPEIADHIARHDPARVLAEVAAKRAIVALAVEQFAAADAKAGDQATRSFDAGAAFAMHNVLRALASVFEGAPGWQEEWR